MKNHIISLFVGVSVQSEFDDILDTLLELQHKSNFTMTSTTNVKVLNTDILSIHIDQNSHGTQHSL